MVQTRLAHIRDRELQSRLLDEGLLEARQIQDVLARQYQHYQASHEELRGQLYQVHLKGQLLQVKQSIEQSLLNSVELAPEHTSRLARELDWPSWGRQLLLLDPEAPRLLDSKSWMPGDSMGLTLSSSWSYLHTPDLGGQPYLVQTRSLLNPHTAPDGAESGPYDLFTDAQHRLLCVCDRTPGDLWLIDTDNYQVRDIFTLRNQPGNRALMLEPDPERERILFVDQERSSLSVLEYREGVLEEFRLGEQVPVNLALHGDRLYLLLSKPKPEILCLHPLSLKELFRIPLPAPLYGEQSLGVATPFALSPDGNWLAVLLGSTGDQALHWLDTRQLVLTEPEVLKGRPQPLQLAFAVPNPLHRYRRRLAQLLLDEKLISENTLLNLFPLPEDEDTVLEVIGPDSAHGSDGETDRSSRLPELPPEPALPVKPATEAALLFLSPIERLTSLPEAHAAENMPLSDEVDEDILHVLSGSFFQHTGVDLETYPQALDKLRQLAHEYRLQLQDHDVIPVDIENLIPETRLKTVLLRESILALIQLRKATERQPYDTPPSHCPDCRSPLLGHWDCDTCGAELLNPERAVKRRMASTLAHTWLPSGYFAIPDVQSGRMLVVDTHRYSYVTWQIDFRYLPGARQPWDMLWLDHLSLLLTDRGANRVLECSHAGRILWELDTSASPEMGLDKPVKATRYFVAGDARYLIVDQGQHRILEVDRRQKMTWHFGHRGLLGDGPRFLNTPNDVQYTHEESYLITDTGNDRVLEIKNDQVVHVFGTDIRLKRPAFAERLFNGNTLIVDAGHYRLLEIEPTGRLKREVVYFKEGMDERFDMAWPLKMVRRENQNIVLIDANRVMEIDVLSKQIVWFSFIHELKLDLELPTRLRQAEIKMPSQKNFENFHVQTPNPDHMPTLRRTLQKIEYFAEESPPFFDALEDLLHYRRYAAGEAIMRRGQPGHSFFVLQSGKAEVLSEQETPTLVIEPGESFGFSGLVYREPIKSTVRALEECGVYVLEKKDFDVFIQAYPAIEQTISQLAQERLVLSRLRQTPKSQQAASRLQTLINAHKERAHQRLARLGNPALVGDTAEDTATEHRSHRLAYSELERRVMAAAAQEGLNSLELHISLRRDARMKAARVALIASLLDRVGTIIRTDPLPELIMKEQLENEVILTLLTKVSPEQLRDDISAISDVVAVNVLGVEA